MTNLPNSAQTENILLTGATGVLGASLMKELLRHTQNHVHCLVRGESPEHARERAKTFLQVYDPEGHLAEAFQKRVSVHCGDVTRPHLGLEAKAYDHLCERIDITLHSAASTNLFSTFKILEEINVGGTKNIIEFCLKTPSKRLLNVSSYSVMGDKTFVPGFVFRETDLDVGQNFSGFPYQETKFLGEKLVREASAKGLKWITVRPGQIYGESETGFYPLGLSNVGSLFYDIFKTFILTGVTLDSSWNYDITPVDYVSTAIIELALRNPVYGETYHLTNPHIQPFRATAKVMQEFGYAIEIIPVKDYLDLLHKNKILFHGKPYKSTTLRMFRIWDRTGTFNFQDSAIAECAATTKVLIPKGVICPKMDLDLLGAYFEAGIREGFFPAVENRDDEQLCREVSAS